MKSVQLHILNLNSSCSASPLAKCQQLHTPLTAFLARNNAGTRSFSNMSSTTRSRAALDIPFGSAAIMANSEGSVLKRSLRFTHKKQYELVM